ncbi:pilus assembly protein TadG-related protein [Agrococcus casei]|uniref:Uncharacterized protein n=1 Tax=Agrococcus casei LMG 22410 TaxID=1255656 RepID=A0A1R4FJH3_9MICO|nr:pilus assembly protein TadG-related protein [Agrococcus casei]SJM55912.1 hypothetical protein CZ674_04765 [Agrococcus casei LMG 22410]
MRTPRVYDFLRKLRTDQNGEASVWAVLLIVPLIVTAGLVFDAAAQTQAKSEAAQIAAGAARAGTSALGGQLTDPTDYSFAPGQAQAAAESYLTQSGVDGTVTVAGGTITVTVNNPIDTTFVSLIGINELPASATSAAELITGE